ncbi:28S ribosomal protein S21 mitochondrial, partial [Biomphalaria pfeifferi]
ILKREKFFTEVKRKERYEKPFLTRNRLTYERCRRIYDSEMKRKISFVMRKNRPDPFLR